MTDSDVADQRVLGSLRKADGRAIIHVEDVYATDIDDLWSAITTPERLGRWLAVVTGDTAKGQWFDARFTSNWTGQLRVEVCDAPHHLKVTGSDGDVDTETTMEAWLTTEGEGTRLVVEERGLVREDVGYHGSGWQTHLEDLASEVAHKTPNDWEPRWKELTPTYLEMAKNL